MPTLTIDWQRSPRIIIVDQPDTQISAQQLVDLLRDAEDETENAAEPKIINASGKEDLGGGTLVGITAELQNAKVGFAQRTNLLESGTVTTADASGKKLTDSAATFQTNNVELGDLVVNTVDGSHASVIEVTAEDEVLTTGLSGGSDNQFASADTYEIWEVVLCEITGGNTVAIDDLGASIDPVLPTFGTYPVISKASTGTLQEQGDIQHGSFDGGIHINPETGISGSTYPAGNVENPVNNLTDAAAVNAVRNFNKYFVEKSLTGANKLSNQADWTDATFIGASIIDTVVEIDALADLTKAEFFNISLEGSLGQTTIIQQCFLGETNPIVDLRGVIEDTSIGPSPVTLGGPNTDTVRFTRCNGAGLDTSPATINGNGDGPQLEIQDQTGQLKLANKSGEAFWDVHINGELIIDESCTNGIIRVLGQGNLEDNSAPGCLVIDKMIHGDELSEIYAYTGLKRGNPMIHRPNLSRSTDGAIQVSRNRQQSIMRQGSAITEKLTRLAPAGEAFNFALTSDLIDSTNNMGTTFSRSSVGYYIDDASGLIVSAGVDTPRFELAGLLVEGSRTNKLIRSQEIDNGIWGKTAATITANAIAAPDGVVSADALREDGTTGVHLVGQNEATWSNSTDYVHSVFLKAANRAFGQVRIRPGDLQFGITSFDLTTGALQDFSGFEPDHSGVDAYPNGWFRCYASRLNTTGTADSGQQVFAEDSLGGQSFTGLNQDSIYVWNNVLEEGQFPTSPIVTVGSEVTRSADFLTADDNSVLLDSEGTIYAEITPLFNADQPNEAIIVNTADQLVGQLYILDDAGTNKVAIGDGTNVAKLDPNFVRGQTYKVACRWSSVLNEIQIIVNGVASPTAPYDGSFARAASDLYLLSGSSAFQFNGNGRNIRGYNVDRGESQLKVDTG